jgi:hypothetical protein
MPRDTQAKVKSQAHNQKGFSLFWNLLIPAAALLVCFAALEVFARSAVSQKIFPLRSYGNYHAQFEIKWNKLEKFVKDNGGVDVILLGNSMVNTGIDPALFASEYANLTDTKPLRVFNFGVEGLTVSPNFKIATLLNDTYSPASIVFFTEMRDYVPGNGTEVETELFSDPWLSYLVSGKGVVGRVINQSAALQLTLPYRQWANPDFMDIFLRNTSRTLATSDAGYEPETRLRNDIDARPDPNNPDDAYFFSLYSDFSIDPTRLNNLYALLNLKSEKTRVFVTEIPAFFTFYDYFGGAGVHAKFVNDIQNYVVSAGGTFIQPVSGDEISLDGRADRLHLNSAGANIFSKLLARQFYLVCEEDQVCLRSK